MREYSSFYRYIYERNGSYEIIKDNEKYGTYNTLADALYERDRLEAVDWDWDLSMELPETINGYIHIQLPPYNHKGSNITYDKEHWVVRGKGRRAKYYGTYYTEEEAKKVALIYNAKISHRNSAYRVQRRVDGKTTYFGRYKTYEEAEERVKELEKNGWIK